MPDKPKTWDQFEIKAELHRRGMTLTKLAEINKLNPGTFRAVWKRPNQKVERALSAFLKVPVERLFPDRYPKRSHTILSRKYAKESIPAQTSHKKDAA
ncbi:helix-turn-helix domain-containing protein [Martelella mediterranea]|uniref:Nlp family transcriptional regulator n=1 Tax=Martelella mediterranea TaxID=293089 RepID=A0A4R3NSZ0_9HYPH|nr:helix-turn-helix transcriptional regulator [Martelella mediterranea]TCT39594.1 Nlp family transcriptional regulator [Martelella mediterranea]